MGIEDRFVLVYPGRLGRWHYTAEMLSVVAGILGAFEDAFFLMLTPDVDEGRRMAKAILPESRYDIRYVRHPEVPALLRASDLGLLLREPHPLNEVACPTKFGEYILCGLPVLISAGIGDCSPFVRDEQAGAVLESPDPSEAVKAVERLRGEPDNARRARIGALAAAFSRKRAAAEMAAVYRRLAEERTD